MPENLILEPQLASLVRIKLLLMDVDGTLTDGSVYFDDAGKEMKRFNIHDGLGIVLARQVNLQIGWITGRKSTIVERRARELGVPLLRQGARDKATAFVELTLRAGVLPEEVAFLGDDLNDIPAMHLAGAVCAPSNAVAEVRALAHYIAPHAGGDGAARDTIEAILHARGDYDAALGAYLLSLSVPAIGMVQ